MICVNRVTIICSENGPNSSMYSNKSISRRPNIGITMQNVPEGVGKASKTETMAEWDSFFNIST